MPRTLGGNWSCRPILCRAARASSGEIKGGDFNFQPIIFIVLIVRHNPLIKDSLLYVGFKQNNVKGGQAPVGGFVTYCRLGLILTLE